MDQVFVDREAMDVAATHVGLHTVELNAVHAAAQEQLDASHGGLVGDSARALNALSDRWRETTRHHVARLEAFQGHIHAAAAGFDQVDRENAVGIQRVADGLAGGS